MQPRDVARLIGSGVRHILEIGANDGEDSQRFIEAIPECMLYCFEPDPRCIEKWRLRNLPANAILDTRAVSDMDDHSGVTPFYQSGGWPPNSLGHGEWDKSSSLLPILPPDKNDSPWMRSPGAIEVKTVRLDTWLTEHPELTHIDFIWCDVQGAEPSVFRGGQRLLEITDWVYCECQKQQEYVGQPGLDEVMDSLPGFKLVRHYGDNHLFGRNHSG